MEFTRELKTPKIFNAKNYEVTSPYDDFTRSLKEIFSTESSAGRRIWYFPVIRKGFSGEMEIMLEASNKTRLSVPIRSTGQREAFPLILGILYAMNMKGIEFLIVEEPEMGLHPRGIISLMNLVFFLVKHRSVKVLISTHSTFILRLFWALSLVKDFPEHLRVFFEKILEMEDAESYANYFKNLRFSFLYFEGGAIKKLRTLSLFSEDKEEATWGGILLKSREISDLIASLPEVEA